MSVSAKKPIRVLNNTKYFEPSRSRLYNRFSSPCSYRSRQIKIEGYETRLYWQFRYCQDHDGQVFYYTLTYNDRAIPKFYNVNCFDYEDLRYLLTGGFYQYLRRYYGTKFKYFVGAELGDGKGKRGMHNNPHYHILFFLEPDDNPLISYEKISPKDFRHLVRLYWQGFDQDEDGYKDYRDAKFGIAKEGDDCGLVSDFRACCYCAKYVTKDVKLVMSEDKIAHYVRFYTTKTYKHSLESFRSFYQANKSLFDTHLLLTSNFDSVCAIVQSLGLELQSGEYQGDYYSLIKSLDLYEDYCKFVRDYVDGKVKEVINLFRNRYCNKCRISQGVGKYALEHIEDKLNPLIQVPSKDGFKNRPLPLYLYRKLYTDVVKVDECVKTRIGVLKPRKHCPVRVLNDLGVELILKRLDKQIYGLSEQARNHLMILCNNEPLYNLMLASDVNTAVSMSYSQFQNELRNIQVDFPISEIFKRYAEFKLVYEDRFFPYPGNRGDSLDSIPSINLESDYKRFITSPLFTVSRSDLRLQSFVESNMAGYLPYFAHPYFLRFYSIFNLLDLCSDYFFVQNDDKAQSEAEHIAEIKRFHNYRKLIEFYSSFKSNIL